MHVTKKLVVKQHLQNVIVSLQNPNDIRINLSYNLQIF